MSASYTRFILPLSQRFCKSLQPPLPHPSLKRPRSPIRGEFHRVRSSRVPTSGKCVSTQYFSPVPAQNELVPAHVLSASPVIGWTPRADQCLRCGHNDHVTDQCRDRPFCPFHKYGGHSFNDCTRFPEEREFTVNFVNRNHSGLSLPLHCGLSASSHSGIPSLPSLPPSTSSHRPLTPTSTSPQPLLQFPSTPQQPLLPLPPTSPQPPPSPPITHAQSRLPLSSPPTTHLQSPPPSHPLLPALYIAPTPPSLPLLPPSSLPPFHASVSPPSPIPGPSAHSPPSRPPCPLDTPPAPSLSHPPSLSPLLIPLPSTLLGSPFPLPSSPLQPCHLSPTPRSPPSRSPRPRSPRPRSPRPRSPRPRSPPPRSPRPRSPRPRSPRPRSPPPRSPSPHPPPLPTGLTPHNCEPIEKFAGTIDELIDEVENIVTSNGISLDDRMFPIVCLHEALVRLDYEVETVNSARLAFKGYPKLLQTWSTFKKVFRSAFGNSTLD